jgi:hypothetical protein
LEVLLGFIVVIFRFRFERSEVLVVLLLSRINDEIEWIGDGVELGAHRFGEDELFDLFVLEKSEFVVHIVHNLQSSGIELAIKDGTVSVSCSTETQLNKLENGMLISFVELLARAEGEERLLNVID